LVSGLEQWSLRRDLIGKSESPQWVCDADRRQFGANGAGLVAGDVDRGCALIRAGRVCAIIRGRIAANEQSYIQIGGRIMDIAQVSEYARALYNTHGGKAEAEAAQKMRDCEEAGKTDEAEDWRAVREAIHAIRGAN